MAASLPGCNLAHKALSLPCVNFVKYNVGAKRIIGIENDLLLFDSVLMLIELTLSVLRRPRCYLSIV